MPSDSYPLLYTINSPQDLKALNNTQLQSLAHELRAYLIDIISQTSGHFASGLGVVELTIALHKVYNTPSDHIIWDVGHQAYPHKILTGRRDALPTIRKKDGLHPFPWRFESEYDVLSTGHASTSISAGLGLAVADQLKKQSNKTVCVIGDGALTAGMAFEGLNHTGDLKPDLLVICNDNEMSISPNVGAFNQHLTKLFLSSTYSSLRENSKKIAEHFAPLGHLLKKTETQIKSLISPSALIEELGFNYIGPVDGHNLEELIEVLTRVKQMPGPKFLHVKTQKGKGFQPAELNPTQWHGVSTFDKQSGSMHVKKEQTLSYSALFGQWLCQQAASDPSLIAITPAMTEGSGLVPFSQAYPDQFFDVGIAEQHAVTFATGLALGGFKPFVAIYSTFLQRAYDQVIHDVALQKLPVVFVIDRGGVVGEDGPTHQGAFDLSFLRVIPDLIIMTPSSGRECLAMLNTSLITHQPVAIRFPKGITELTEPTIEHVAPLPIGAGQVVRSGESIAILNFGTLLNEALIAADALNASVVDMRFVKPLDEKLINNMVNSHSLIVTLEENSIIGGCGSAVNEFILNHQLDVKVLNLGLPDHFILQGKQHEIRDELGLTATHIIDKIKQVKV